MRLIRVGDSPALPTEKTLWGDSDESCRHEDALNQGRADSQAKETDRTVRRKNSELRGVRDCRWRNETASKDALIPRDVINARRSPRPYVSAKGYPWEKSSARFIDVNQERFAPRISSSTRCYAPRDQHKSAIPGRERDSGSRRTVEDEVRAPSWSYDDGIRGTAPDRGAGRAGARGFVGTKRFERESDLCNVSECKRHSRSYSNQKHGGGRCASNIAKKVVFADSKVHVEHTRKGRLDWRPNRSEIGDQESQGKLEDPKYASCNLEAKPSAPQHSLEQTSTADCKIEADADIQKQYEMLASLLLEDPLDIDQDFELSASPVQVDVQYCGSIFEDSIEFGSTEVTLAAETLDDINNCEVLITRGPSNGLGADETEGIPLCDESGDQLSVSMLSPSLANTGAFSTGAGEESLLTDGQTISPMVAVPVSKVSSIKIESRGDPTELGTVPGTSGHTQGEAVSARSRQPPSRVFVDVTNKFKIQTAPVVKEEVKENDCHRLSQRQRQIDFGKNTLGYERYSDLVPRWKRTRKDPQTPNPRQVCSKRSWDGQIRKWRRLLHAYDPPLEEGEELPAEFGIRKLSGESEPRDPNARGHERFYGEENDAPDDSKKQKLIDRIKGTALSNKDENPESRHDCNKFGPQLKRPELGLSIYGDWTES